MVAINASDTLAMAICISMVVLPSPVLNTRANPLPEMTEVPIKIILSSSNSSVSVLTPCKTLVFRSGSLSPVRLKKSQYDRKEPYKFEFTLIG
jgi:hypothetical protein